jgi:hypothetical protein
MSIYRVDFAVTFPLTPDTAETRHYFRLVQAKTKAGAIAHVAKKLLHARLATFEDGREGERSGVRVEDAGEEEAA